MSFQLPFNSHNNLNKSTSTMSCPPYIFLLESWTLFCSQVSNVSTVPLFVMVSSLTNNISIQALLSDVWTSCTLQQVFYITLWCSLPSDSWSSLLVNSKQGICNSAVPCKIHTFGIPHFNSMPCYVNYIEITFTLNFNRCSLLCNLYS